MAAEVTTGLDVHNLINLDELQRDLDDARSSIQQWVARRELDLQAAPCITYFSAQLHQPFVPRLDAPTPIPADTQRSRAENHLSYPT